MFITVVAEMALLHTSRYRASVPLSPCPLPRSWSPSENVPRARELDDSDVNVSRSVALPCLCEREMPTNTFCLKLRLTGSLHSFRGINTYVARSGSPVDFRCQIDQSMLEGRSFARLAAAFRTPLASLLRIPEGPKRSRSTWSNSDPPPEGLAQSTSWQCHHSCGSFEWPWKQEHDSSCLPVIKNCVIRFCGTNTEKSGCLLLHEINQSIHRTCVFSRISNANRVRKGIYQRGRF